MSGRAEKWEIISWLNELAVILDQQADHYERLSKYDEVWEQTMARLYRRAMMVRSEAKAMEAE